MLRPLTFTGGHGNDHHSPFRTWRRWRIAGGLGADTLFGGNRDDTIYGGRNNPNDTADGNDHIDGGKGDDLIYGEAGDDTLGGGLGTDSGDDTIYGGAGDDSISGGDGNDRLYGGLDNDTINGGQGNDTLSGGEGIDRMAGGRGNDIYYVDHKDDVVIEGIGGGFDTVYAAVSAESYTLADQVESLTIYDNNISPGTRPFGSGIFNPPFGNGGGVPPISTFDAVGNDLDNIIRNNARAGSEIQGLKGDDELYGNSFSDTLFGGEDNDKLVGNGGQDFLYGGIGFDTLTGGSDRDSLNGWAGDDVLIGIGGASGGLAEIDHLYGGTGSDKFYLFDKETGIDYESHSAGGYAVIEDFNIYVNDTIILERSQRNEYEFAHEFAANIGQADKADTVIYQDGTVIGYVQDVINLNFATDIIFE